MKKLLILLAVLACGVGQAGAQITESGYMKVYVQNQLKVSWTQIILNHWGKDRTGADVHESGTEVIDGITWHVFKLPITYANNTSFLVYSGTWNSDVISTNQSTNYDKDGGVYGDTFFDLKQDDVSSQPYLERQTRIYFYNTSTKVSMKMNTSDFNSYTFVFDNTDGTQNGYYAIATNYAFKNNNDGSINDWSGNAFRPQNSGNKTVDFVEYANENAPRVSDGGGTWYFDKNAVYTITFNLNSWDDAKWSISPYFTREIGTSGYATFSSDYNVTIPGDVDVYYASDANGETGKVTMTKKTNVVKASTGVLLYKSGGGEVTFTPASPTDADEASGNMLLPGEGTTVQSGAIYDYYVLAKKAGGDICFSKLSESTGANVGVGKAYLRVSHGTFPSSAPSLSIFFDDAAGGTTAIDAVKSAEPAVTDGAYYNLAGQRVTNPTKGLYIVNGRKVVVK